MSVNRPGHIVIFAIILGLIAYLASALWSAIFIVPLPMDEDAITDAVERKTVQDRYGNVQTEWRAIEFKNTLERLKYDHNVSMRDRNRYWVYGMLFVGGLIGLFVFYVVPKWRNTLPAESDTSGIAVGGFSLGLGVVLIVPLLLAWLLPAPVKWFPKEIVNIADVRQKAALSRLEGLAKRIDAKRDGERP